MHKNRGFRLRRISFGLPLTSELDALCAEDANPIRYAEMGLTCESQKDRLPY